MGDAVPTGLIDSYRDALASIPPVEEERSGDHLRVVRAFRGMYLDQAVQYLESLGGERVDEHTVEGDGWRATLSQSVAAVGRSYRLTQVTVEWEGEAAKLEPVVLRFRVKAFRAPG
ncbi:MAG: hypothetical protein ABEJ59_01725 [Halanaeroarchaeum sp.]